MIGWDLIVENFFLVGSSGVWVFLVYGGKCVSFVYLVYVFIIEYLECIRFWIRCRLDGSG